MAAGLIKRGAAMLAVFGVVWLLAEALVISTGVLVPADFADRHRVLFEMFEPHPEWGFHTRGNLRDFPVRWRATGVEATYSTDESGFVETTMQRGWRSWGIRLRLAFGWRKTRRSRR